MNYPRSARRHATREVDPRGPAPSHRPAGRHRIHRNGDGEFEDRRCRQLDGGFGRESHARRDRRRSAAPTRRRWARAPAVDIVYDRVGHSLLELQQCSTLGNAKIARTRVCNCSGELTPQSSTTFCQCSLNCGNSRQTSAGTWYALEPNPAARPNSTRPLSRSFRTTREPGPA